MLALPVGWLNSTVVEHFCVVDEGDGKKRLTSAVIDSPVLWQKFRSELYPNLTKVQYRGGIRRLVFDFGAGYRPSALRPDLRRLLGDLITDMGKKRWTCFEKPTAEQQREINNSPMLKDIMITPNNSMREVMRKRTPRRVTKARNGNAVASNPERSTGRTFPTSTASAAVGEINTSQRPELAAGACASGTVSDAAVSDGACTAARSGTGTAVVAAGIADTSNNNINSMDDSNIINNNNNKSNSNNSNIINNNNTFVSGHLSIASQDSALCVLNSSSMPPTMRGIYDRAETGTGINAAAAVLKYIAVADTGVNRATFHDSWDPFQPRCFNKRSYADSNDDETDSDALDSFDNGEMDSDILDVLEYGSDKDDIETLEIGRLLNNMVTKYEVVNDIIIDSDEQQRELERHYTSCFKHPELVGVLLVPKHQGVDLTPHAYSNEQAIRIIGKDVTKEFHQALTLEGMAFASEVILEIIASGPEPWHMHPFLRTPFNCFKEDGVKCIRSIDIWGTIELFNDEHFVATFSPAGENELLYQPGPFRLA